jgi:DNA-binding MarR family transcriptional regulator
MKSSQAATSVNVDSQWHLHFGRRLRSVSRALDRVLNARLSRLGITLSQYALLRELDAKVGLSLRELSARADVADPSTLLTLELMEKRGLVKRKRSETDRRKIDIYLTAAGARILAEGRREHNEANAVAFRGLSQRDLAVALMLCETVIENLDERAKRNVEGAM